MTAIIVTWNRPDLLGTCLRTLTAAGREAGIPVETIVVDNGSTAGDGEVVAREFPAVRLLRAPENLGFARAVNRGLELAAAPNVLLVNNDMEVTPEALREACALLSREPEVGIVGVRLVDLQGSPQKSYGTFETPMRLIAEALGARALAGQSPDEPRAARSAGWTTVDYVSGAFFLIRRAVIDQIGPLDERFYFYAEEADWCLRARQAGWKTAYLPGVSAVHHHGATTGGRSARTRMWLLESRTRFVSKHHGRLWAIPVRVAALMCAGPLLVKGLAMTVLGQVRGRSMVVAGKERIERAWREARWAISRRWECPEFWR